MKLKLLLFLICISLLKISIAQKQAIEWLSFEELAGNYQKEQKPILFFLYTDWCKYCKMQENTTFQDSAVISELNQNYYSIKLDAESKTAILFFGREYNFNQESGFHELATYLGSNDGKLEFPTTLILNRQLEPIFRKNALVKQEEMKALFN